MCNSGADLQIPLMFWVVPTLENNIKPPKNGVKFPIIQLIHPGKLTWNQPMDRLDEDFPFSILLGEFSAFSYLQGCMTLMKHHDTLHLKPTANAPEKWMLGRIHSFPFGVSAYFQVLFFGCSFFREGLTLDGLT